MALGPRFSPEHLVDLLEEVPRYRIDPHATDVALVFAYAGSGTGGLFSDALRRALLAESSFDPKGYADDLYLARMVQDCFVAPIEGTFSACLTEPAYLTRLVSTPPDDVRSVELRRAILRELSQRPDLFGSLTELHGKLLQFRSLMENSHGGRKWDLNHRQLEVLGCLRELFTHMAGEFATATSPLARLASFGRRVCEGEPFQSLSQLLHFDEELASVDLHVRIGSDGHIRELSIGKVRENTENTFRNPPLQRALARCELFLRGFSFSKGEVMARLLDAAYEGVRSELPILVQLLGDLEFYLGAMRFRALAESRGLTVSLPEFGPSDAPREMLGLFNPLLLGAGIRPIPCDVCTDRADTTLLVTGPNSGGKTRLLQSFGIAQLLAQCGMFAPARLARMTWSTGLLVSLIQENAADQTEGRLGMELLRIRSLFERLQKGAIVILDELCSGTNPSEGEEIFELVVRMLTKLRPQAYITTHFLTFAARLEREHRIDDLRFLQVVCGESQTPTYQFAPGVAATSLASHAAERLGVTADQLLSLIDRRLART